MNVPQTGGPGVLVFSLKVKGWWITRRPAGSGASAGSGVDCKLRGLTIVGPSLSLAPKTLRN